jgi:dihydrofolate synthase/folylpolyglutamate synthase
MEIVQTKPTVILDCAKDADAAEKLAEAVKEELGINSNALILVISISADKNISRMMRALAPLAHHTIVTSHKVAGRAASPQIIAKELEKDGKEYEIVPDVEDAVKKAIKIAGKDRYVLVTGSVFTVAEARRIWFDKHESKLGLQFNDIPKR